MKEDVCNIPVWVKFHDVPITVFTQDGLSAIATKLGKSLMLDSYTAAMCTDSWGRASYAREMIKLIADVELRDTIAVVVPKFRDDYPNKIVSDISKNSNMSSQPARGPPVGLKPKSTFVYRPVSTKKAVKANGNSKIQTANKATTLILNSFDTLSTLVDEEDGEGNQTSSTNATPVVTNKALASKPITSMGDQLVKSDEDEVEFPDDRTSRYMALTSGGGFLEYDLDFYNGYEAQV
ncbi:U5 small nuclear ribonucleoprotein helicase [Tanacetum coccineum]